jgi:thiazole/oxazole-forming peptide maturase SagC family component
MDKFRIKPYFSTIIHNPNMVELRYGVWNCISHLLNDENEEGILSKIILRLNGQFTPAEIADELEISRSKIESMLDYLLQFNVLQVHSESFFDYYVENLIPTLKRPNQINYQASMPVIFLGDNIINYKIRAQLEEILNIEMIEDPILWSLILKSGDDWLFDALEQEQFIEAFRVWQGKFIIFSSQHINPILATRLNRIAYELNISWLHLAIDGPFIFIGPTFQGNKGPCYDCFETRIGMNLRESNSYQNYKNALQKNHVYNQDDPLLAITSNLLATHGTMEILNYISTRCSFTTNKTLSIFLPTMEFIFHDLIRLTACRTCGSLSHRDNTQLYFDYQKIAEEGA